MSKPGDFDFLIGTWDVANRTLVSLDSDEWDEYPAVATCHGTLFNGAANQDEIIFPTKGVSGLTLRLYDPERDEWSIHWASSRTGRLSPPMVGGFDADGRGEFYGDDEYEGKPIPCRFIWSRITPVSARWEQAYSFDGGQTWRTNWIMSLSRTGPPPSATAVGSVSGGSPE